jgi:hypothetical protein
LFVQCSTGIGLSLGLAPVLVKQCFHRVAEAQCLHKGMC